jgi:hypothetical protein
VQHCRSRADRGGVRQRCATRCVRCRRQGRLRAGVGLLEDWVWHQSADHATALVGLGVPLDSESDPPARVAIGVAALPRGAQVEEQKLRENGAEGAAEVLEAKQGAFTVRRGDPQQVDNTSIVWKLKLKVSPQTASPTSRPAPSSWSTTTLDWSLGSQSTGNIMPTVGEFISDHPPLTSTVNVLPVCPSDVVRPNVTAMVHRPAR